MKKKKIFKIILISYAIIILLLFGILVVLKIKENKEKESIQSIKQYDVLNFPNLDSSWQQYQSPYGYQVSYPHDWKLIANSPYEAFSIARLASPRAYSFAKEREEKQENIADEKLAPLLHIITYDSFTGLKENLTSKNKVPGNSLEQIAENLNKAEDYYNVYTQPFIFYIGPNKAYAVGKAFLDSNGNQQDTQQLMILMENNNFYYNIIFNDVGAITKLGDEEIKILSSIKLVEPTEKEIKRFEIKDGDLQNYKNSTFGLKLKISNNWKIKQENNNLIFSSPENLISQEWCELQFCEGPTNDFDITKYDDFNEFINNQNIQSEQIKNKNELKTIEDVLRIKKKTGEVISYNEIYINKYSAFGVELSGMCGSYTVLINYESKIYEIYFICGENKAALSEVEKNVLNSIEFF